MNYRVVLAHVMVMLMVATVTLGLFTRVVSGNQDDFRSESTHDFQEQQEAKIIYVNNTARLLSAINDASPGQMIVLRDGIFDGHESVSIFGQHGTEENPLIITAENVGKAIISGKLQFVISNSSFITIRGLVFKTVGGGRHTGKDRKTNGAVILHNASHVRITRNHFALDEELGSTQLKDWVTVGGKDGGYNRIDHNLFENKLQNGSFISINNVTAEDTMPRHTLIDHNHFRDMEPLGINGMEAVRIGVGSTDLSSVIDTFTVFEYNLMERVDGEKAEIISIKSSNNTVRYNSIIDTAGSITFRMGHSNSVYGNYFIGHRKPGSGGVRIYGRNQRVFNNYFQDLANAAVIVGYGNAEGLSDLEGAGYLRPNGVDVVFNTFINNTTNFSYSQNRAIDILPPLNVQVANNIVYSDRVTRWIPIQQISSLDSIEVNNNIAYSGAPSMIVTNRLNKEVRIDDPNFILGIDHVRYIDGESAAVGASTGAFPYVEYDIEGKKRDGEPDVGAFEYAGLPLLRGPLSIDEVGPYAGERAGVFSPDEPGVYVTTLNISGFQHDGTADWSGPLTVEIDGVTTGDVHGDVDVHLFVNGVEVDHKIGFPMWVTVNRGELDEGEHQLTVLAESGGLIDIRSLRFKVRNVAVISPRHGENVRGIRPVTFNVGLPESMIQNVKVSIGDEVLYSGPIVPGKLHMDTSMLHEGNHDLTLDVTRNCGTVISDTVNFAVDNFWEIEDPLEPPVDWGWLGIVDQLLTSSKSSGWGYVGDESSDGFDDPHRLIRSTESTEYLTWETPRLHRAEIVVYSRSGNLDSEEVEIAVSSDGIKFYRLNYTETVVSQLENGWFKLNLSMEVGENSPMDGADIRYFRITINQVNLLVEQLQIGHVRLTGWNE